MPSTPYRRCTRPYHPHLELLEQREVPTVLTVTNLLDNGTGSLRAAVASAQDGDIVQFADGLSGQITLTTGEIGINHSIDIEGPGAEVITVSGNHASRVFDIAAVLTVDISGLTIAEGSVTNANGGGISNSGTLTIANSVLRDNSVLSDSSGPNGGGIYSDGTLVVTGTTFDGNSARTESHEFGSGGGIYSTGMATITASIFTRNSSGGGGGGISSSGSMTVATSNFSSNSSFNNGGGIYSTGMATIIDSSINRNSALLGGGIMNVSGFMTITDSTVTGNSPVDGYGGGIDNYHGTVSILGSTISDNAAYGAGGIINYDSGTLTIRDSMISGNSAIRTDGGGIVNYGTATIIDCTISGNSASEGKGGGIYVESFGPVPTLAIVGSTLSDNSASAGGGIYNDYGGGLTITRSTLSRNSAGSGGGIVNYPSGRVAITDSTLSGNTANGTFSAGGGVQNLGTLTITRATFNGNSANGTNAVGGCIESGTAVIITDSTFSGNSANGTFSAGGCIDNLSMLTVTSSTFSGNSASNAGGIYQDPRFGTTTIQNTILAANSGSPSPDVNGPLTSRGHNLIGDGTGGTGFDSADLVGTAENPIDPLLGPLQDNGGPTPTMALLVGSPAIAAGDPSEAPPTDQRGAPRVVNGTSDIGAYEVQPAPALSCSVTRSLLWPPNHQLINVGFGVRLNEDADPSTQLSVQVYANDNAVVSDAADIDPDTLQLRAERQGNGQGRVYLIAATATDASGQTGFDVCTVVVPHDQSARSRAQVQAAAAAAVAYYQESQTAPPGYALLGEESAAAGNHDSALAAALGAALQLPPIAPGQSPTPPAAPATNAPTHSPVAPVDDCFVAAHEVSGKGFEASVARSKTHHRLDSFDRTDESRIMPEPADAV